MQAMELELTELWEQLCECDFKDSSLQKEFDKLQDFMEQEEQIWQVHSLKPI